MNLVADIDAPRVDRPPRSAGIEHPPLNGGGEAFPLPRREHHDLDREFADVIKNLLRRLRKVDHQRHQQADGNAEELLCRPGRGDVGEIFHARLDAGRRDNAMRVVDEIAMRQHHALGSPSSARRIRQHRDIIGLPRLDQFAETIGILGMTRTPNFEHVFERRQPRMVIGPHPGVVPVDQLTQMRHAIEDRQPLIHLLLILRHQTNRIAVIKQVFDFVGGDIRIERDDLAAD